MQKDRQKKLVILSVVIGVSLLITAFVIYQSQKPIGEIRLLEEKTRPETNALTMGNPDAAIVVEEFSDFQCIACYRFWSNFESEFIEKYVATGDVLFKYVPFSFIGDESFQAAEAALCAEEQGRFWDYHDMLFLNWNGENVGNFSDRRLVAFAGELGLDENSFQTCLSSNRHNAEVQEGLRYGRSLGVNATPTFTVNGTVVFGDTLFATIDGLLGN